MDHKKYKEWREDIEKFFEFEKATTIDLTFIRCERFHKLTLKKMINAFAGFKDEGIQKYLTAVRRNSIIPPVF